MQTVGQMTEPESGQPPSSPIISVLVADDHRMFAESVARILEDEEDMRVVAICHSSLEAVTLAGTKQPDVAIVDYRLPDADGAVTARGIRSISPRTQVVMITASSDERLLVSAIEAGCTGFLTKDKAASELVASVRHAHAGEAYINPRLLAGLLRRMDRTQPGLGSDLTGREREVLTLLGDGLTNRAIADKLFLSLNTVRNHVQNVLTKLEAHSKLEAVTKATRAGLLSASGPEP
jgi:DNA-binding NarL/FixJ family response regulator